MIRAFGVGQAKSGTASLHGLLEKHYRSAHEPERPQTLDLVLRRDRGEISEAAARDDLVRRERRLDLEFDIAWANQFLTGLLLEAFPEAKFVVLVRHPIPWVKSFIGHLLSRDVPREVVEFLPWWLRDGRWRHGEGDVALERAGIAPVVAFLDAWNRHLEACAAIPPERRIVVRTHELDASHERLARFLGIPADSLDRERGHRNRGTWEDRLESWVDRSWLENAVERVCGENVARHFPEGLPVTNDSPPIDPAP